MDIQNGVLCQNEKGQLVLGTSFGTICKDAGSVVMQFAGKEDFNGTKIFEDDILDEKYKWIVKYANCEFIAYSKITGRTENLYKLIQKSRKAGIPIKIIGNVHEHSYLLQ